MTLVTLQRQKTEGNIINLELTSCKSEFTALDSFATVVSTDLDRHYVGVPGVVTGVGPLSWYLKSKNNSCGLQR